MPDASAEYLTAIDAHRLVACRGELLLLRSRLDSLTRAADAALGALRVSLAGSDAITTLAAQIAAAEAALRVTRPSEAA